MGAHEDISNMLVDRRKQKSKRHLDAGPGSLVETALHPTPANMWPVSSIKAETL